MAVGAGVLVGSGVAVLVGIGVAVGVGTGVLVAVGRGVAVAVGSGVLVGTGVLVGEGVGAMMLTNDGTPTPSTVPCASTNWQVMYWIPAVPNWTPDAPLPAASKVTVSMT